MEAGAQSAVGPIVLDEGSLALLSNSARWYSQLAFLSHFSLDELMGNHQELLPGYSTSLKVTFIWLYAAI